MMTLAEAIAEVQQCQHGELATWYATKCILEAVASGDLIPKADAELAVAAAYQRAAEWYRANGWTLDGGDAILALAHAEPLAEVEKLRREIEVTNACNNGLGRLNDVVRKRAETAEAEVARLRKALEDIADGMGETEMVEIGRFAPVVARAALTTPEKGETE